MKRVRVFVSRLLAVVRSGEHERPRGRSCADGRRAIASYIPDRRVTAVHPVNALRAQ